LVDYLPQTGDILVDYLPQAGGILVDYLPQAGGILVDYLSQAGGILVDFLFVFVCLVLFLVVFFKQLDDFFSIFCVYLSH
jgi:hypothetical protein